MEEQYTLSEPPRGWVWAKLGDVCDLINGRVFKPSEWSLEGVPIVRIQNLNKTEAEFNYCSFEVESKYVVNNGQLLFGWSGTPETSFGAHIWNRGRAFLNQHIFKVEIDENCIDKIFLKHLLNHNVKEYIGKAHGTAGLAHITKGKFENSLIALPPFNEQHRIASKVEELFSYLDAGVESLLKVKTLSKRHRHAVLKYAFEGKLTEEWRKNHKHQIEPAQKLLEHIKQERKEKGKYEKLLSTDTSSLPELPESWTWTRVADISEMMQYGTSEKAGTDANGVPVLRMGNIQDGKLLFDDLKYFHQDQPRLKEFFLEEGDVLFNRTNSAELVGKTAVYEKHHPKAVFASYLIRIKTNKNTYNSSLLSHYINSFHGRRYINTVVSQQVGQANVNGTKLSLMPIPLMSYEEQWEINGKIERNLSIIYVAEKNVGQALIKSERMRQSILKKAFEGKLVPQDPTDEPAEKLLERIKGNKTEQNIKNKDSTRDAGLMHYVK